MGQEEFSDLVPKGQIAPWVKYSEVKDKVKLKLAEIAEKLKPMAIAANMLSLGLQLHKDSPNSAGNQRKLDDLKGHVLSLAERMAYVEQMLRGGSNAGTFIGEAKGQMEQGADRAATDLRASGIKIIRGVGIF